LKINGLEEARATVEEVDRIKKILSLEPTEVNRCPVCGLRTKGRIHALCSLILLGEELPDGQG
jgi:hypothetical protein